MNEKTVKAIGFISTIVGFAATAATNWSNDKKTDKVIDEKVQKAFTNYAKEKGL